MKKLLVTGASGFLGWNICNAAIKGWDIFGTVLTHHADIAGVKIIRVDLRDFKELKKIFQEIHPNAVIHTAAVTNLNYCQTNREESQRVNVDASVHIADLCSDHQIPCVFTSTDIVFDGLNPPYREEDPVCPVNYYGEQKAKAEEDMLRRYPSTAVCRMPLMFGISGTANTSFIQPMVKAMKEGRELKLFTDEVRTPISGNTAVQGLFLALDNIKGIINLGGMERISRYDFARLFMRVIGIQKANLLPCKQRDVNMPAPRPPDVSLDSSKAIALGFRPLPLEDELKEIREMLRYLYP